MAFGLPSAHKSVVCVDCIDIACFSWVAAIKASIFSAIPVSVAAGAGVGGGSVKAVTCYVLGCIASSTAVGYINTWSFPVPWYNPPSSGEVITKGPPVPFNAKSPVFLAMA